MRFSTTDTKGGSIAGFAGLVLVAALGNCGSSDGAESRSPVTTVEQATISTATNDARFTGSVDHGFFPLAPGMRWEYEVRTPEGTRDQLVAEVTSETRLIGEVTTTVVRVTLTADGELEEETFTWYAQDDDGNVWIFGEVDRGHESGSLVETTTWEAGVDGAEAGIVIPGDPMVGDEYRVGHLAGEVEEMARIVDLDAAVDATAGSFSGVLVIENWSELEPDVVEQKFYAPGIGFVYQASAAADTDIVSLVSFSE